MQPKTRHTYRYIEQGVSNLSDAIGNLLTHVQDATGRLPAVLIVPKSQQSEAQRVIDMVGRAYAKGGKSVDIQVLPVGGCLVGEVWWQEDV